MFAGDVSILQYLIPIILQRNSYEFAVNVLLHLIRTAKPTGPSSNIALLQHIFASAKSHTPPYNALVYYCCQSQLFQRDKRQRQWRVPLSNEERQLSAKLHVMYGVPVLDHGQPINHRVSHSRTYSIACSTVYDLRNYTANTHWGPFLDDGSLRVDWEKIEAVMVVIGYNLKEYRNERGQDVAKAVWKEPFAGAVPYSYRPTYLAYQEGQKNLLDADDPYGVTGTYLRVSIQRILYLRWRDTNARQ